MDHSLFKDIHDPFDDEGGPVDWEKGKIANRILGIDREKEKMMTEKRVLEYEDSFGDEPYTVYDMKLHEVKIMKMLGKKPNALIIHRVPGGWIYERTTFSSRDLDYAKPISSISSVFVPYTSYNDHIAQVNESKK